MNVRNRLCQFHALFCKKDTDKEQIELPTVILEVNRSRLYKPCDYMKFINFSNFSVCYLHELKFYCNLVARFYTKILTKIISK
jgi:hypothetical protein